MFARILVALDGSATAELAIPVAAGLARAASAELSLVYVGGPLYGSVDTDEPGARDALAMTAYLDAQAASIRWTHGVTVRAVELEGPVVLELRRYARQWGAELIVMTTHGRSGFNRFVLGSIAEALVRSCTLPVLLVRGVDRHPVPATGPVFRRILVPFDGTPAAHRALGVASRLTASLRGTLTVHSVVPRAEDRSRAESVVRQAIDACVDRSTIRSDVEVSPEPVRAILDRAAADATDLIVLGVNTRSMYRRLRARATAFGVLRGSPCAVLIQPRQQRRTVAPREIRAPMAKLECVVVGIDFGEASFEAARWATRHFAPDAGIVLTHVIDIPRPPGFLKGMFPAQGAVRETVGVGAEARLRDFANTLESRNIHLDIRAGRVASGIAAAAGELNADLVIVGSHDVKSDVPPILGSSIERLIHVSPVPVLVARSHSARTPARILAPIDESRTSERALAAATALCGRFRAQLIAFHALDPTLPGRVGIVSSSGASGRIEREMVESARTWVRHQALASCAQNADVVVAVGPPATEVIAAVRQNEADLVVMGSRGSGAAGRCVLGSVARSVLNAAPCPVLIVTGHPGS